MKPSFLLLVVALLPVSAFAERFGSETTVTLQGIYYISGATTTLPLPNKDTRETTTHTVVKITNATVLQAMRDRSLIPTTNGYRLVMVSRAHMADGTAWFATPNTGTPVPVPSDILALSVSNGPVNGQFVVDQNATLKTLNQQTHNQAGLILGNFTGTGLLTQAWTAKPVKNGTVTEVVELVASTGTFTGAVTIDPSIGVGSIDFKLTGAKTVDLTRYGMASTTTSISGSNTYTGGTSITSGTLILSGGSNINMAYGSFTITGSTFQLSNYNFSSTSTLTINNTTGGSATGLVVDTDGNVTQFPVFGTSLPATLVIITSSGTHTYTHDANGVWSLATP